jgi:protein SCO1
VALQPFSWKAGILFLATGAGLVVYFRYEKARMERKRIAEATKGIGKPKVGGEFDLVDHNGNKFNQESMKGKYALVRGFLSHTHRFDDRCDCPAR